MALVVPSVQDRDLGLLFRRLVSGVMMDFKLWIKWQQKLANPRKRCNSLTVVGIGQCKIADTSYPSE